MVNPKNKQNLLSILGGRGERDDQFKSKRSRLPIIKRTTSTNESRLPILKRATSLPLQIYVVAQERQSHATSCQGYKQRHFFRHPRQSQALKELGFQPPLLATGVYFWNRCWQSGKPKAYKRANGHLYRTNRSQYQNTKSNMQP